LSRIFLIFFLLAIKKRKSLDSSMAENQQDQSRVAPQRFFYSPEETQQLLAAVQSLSQAAHGSVEVAEWGIDDLTRAAAAWLDRLLQTNQTTDPDLLAARAWGIARAFLVEREKFINEMEAERGAGQ
jgi:hypothetical protein